MVDDREAPKFKWESTALVTTPKILPPRERGSGLLDRIFPDLRRSRERNAMQAEVDLERLSYDYRLVIYEALDKHNAFEHSQVMRKHVENQAAMQTRSMAADAITRELKNDRLLLDLKKANYEFKHLTEETVKEK